MARFLAAHHAAQHAGEIDVLDLPKALLFDGAGGCPGIALLRSERRQAYLVAGAIRCAMLQENGKRFQHDVTMARIKS